MTAGRGGLEVAVTRDYRNYCRARVRSGRGRREAPGVPAPHPVLGGPCPVPNARRGFSSTRFQAAILRVSATPRPSGQTRSP